MKDWQSTDWETTQQSDYQQGLLRSSIAVLFGSENLAGLDCDNTRAEEEFLELNPWAKDTLRTRGPRGSTFHFKICGDYPARQEAVDSGLDITVGSETTELLVRRRT